MENPLFFSLGEFDLGFVWSVMWGLLLWVSFLHSVVFGIHRLACISGFSLCGFHCAPAWGLRGNPF